MKYLKRTIFAAVLTFFVGACGGGGSDSVNRFEHLTEPSWESEGDVEFCRKMNKHFEAIGLISSAERETLDKRGWIAFVAAREQKTALAEGCVGRRD
ncbi:MAG: hypothetical protein JKY15_06525 [Deltaproteobacteria bacterium]|nr:hypothetical protein [Deltaproteobacteria bacterium]